MKKQVSPSIFYSSGPTVANINYLFRGKKDATEAISLAYESVAGDLKVTWKCWLNKHNPNSLTAV